MSVVIETTHGSVTTRGAGSLDVTMFYRKNGKAREAPVHEALRDQQAGIRAIGSVEVSPSSAAMTNLKWVQARNEYPDNSLIRINVRRRTMGVVFSNTVANVIIRARSTAPLYELGIVCPTDKNSSRSKVYVIGRFDVLSPDEVQALGLDKSRTGADESMTYEVIDDTNTIFELERKEKELEKYDRTVMTTVQSKSGEKKLVPKLSLKRRIGLR